jgi:hypothetical protein
MARGALRQWLARAAARADSAAIADDRGGDLRRRLLGAYAEHLGVPIGSVADLDAHVSLAGHFGDARLAFYSAEGLRLFSRDTLPPGSFGRLQDDVHAGIKDDVRQRTPTATRGSWPPPRPRRAWH